jgi:hypothetical protein
MGEWIRSVLDIILILMVGVGLYQAMRLIKHLSGLRQGRVEMERFVHEFNATVIRAEAGIKGLRMAARESGDDLEKLVEKAVAVRDELHFIVESADQIAERLSQTASLATRGAAADAKARSETPKAAPAPEPKAAPAVRPVETRESTPPASRAEKELLSALQKLS